VLKFPTLRNMTEGNHVLACAIFRRELWALVHGYFDTGKGKDHVAEGWEFWLRIAATGARIRNIGGKCAPLMRPQCLAVPFRIATWM
jgi:O-antigen biosynthesis protein